MANFGESKLFQKIYQRWRTSALYWIYLDEIW